MMIQKERLLSTFLEYVQIDSESTREGAMAARLTEDMRKAGCRVEMDDSQRETGSETGNLYCTLPGSGSGDAILLSAHMDTVVPGVGVRPLVQDGMIRSGGDTVLGGDDKSGIAVILEVIRTLAERGLPHPEIQVVFTVCEELGLAGSRAIDYGRITAKKAAVLDGGGRPGKIVVSAPGKYGLDAAVLGRRAHAGTAPQEGISAIQVAAEAISHMRLLRIDEETTANIGAIHAQYSTNVVPDRVELQAEARSRNEEKLAAQVRHMEDCLRSACRKFGASLELEVTKGYDAYAYGPEDPFVQEVTQACRRAGLQPQIGVSGGGSDANNLNANGIKALVLGTGMSKVHTLQEEIAVKDLEDTAELVLALTTRQ